MRQKVTRKTLLNIAVVILMAFILIILTVALMPLWLTVGMIAPKLFSSPSAFITQKMTKQMIRGMMTR